MKKFFLLMTTLLTLGQSAWAEEVNFITYKFENEGVKKESSKCTDPVEMKNSGTLTLDDSHKYWVVKGADVKVSDLITIKGKDVHLILCDGAKLTCQKGIFVEWGYTLHIHAQSEGSNKGKLVATGAYNQAGIGGNGGHMNGTIYIHGGDLTVTGGERAAGIGAGTDRNSGPINIYGGTISATGGKYAAGIGGGYAGSQEYDIFICGNAQVKAWGGEKAAGIGGGRRYRGGAVGGKLWVYGDADVYAKGGEYGAGIGGGEDGNGGKAYIKSGKVEAIGGTDAAGIGGGQNGHGDECYIGDTKMVAIVTARGSGKGAGIGGGEKGRGGKVDFAKGSTVTVLAGGECKLGEDDGGSAIGCGYNVAHKTEPSNVTINFGESLLLKIGDEKTVQKRGVRIMACKQNSPIYIEPCEHTGKCFYRPDFADEEHYHYKSCSQCGISEKELHTVGKCLCGKTVNKWTVLYYDAGSTAPNYSDVATVSVYRDQTYALPEPTPVNGLAFKGWLVDPTPAPSSYIMGANENLKHVDDELPKNVNATIYARYEYVYTVSWDWSGESPVLTLKCAANNDTQKPNVSVTKEQNGDVTTWTATASFNGVTYKDVKYEYSSVDLTLEDAADNGSAINTAFEGANLNDITLNGRTFKVGKWNPLCLPFNIDKDEIADTPLKGAVIKELDADNSGFANGVLTLKFVDATEVEAGIPYLVKWTTGTDITSPEFEDFFISWLEPDEVATKDKKAIFKGCFSPVTLTANDKTKLYLSNDKLYYPSVTVTVNSFRGYFDLQGIKMGDPQATVRSIEFDLGDDATGINAVSVKKQDGNYYDLQGRRQQGKPVQKGIYINNGHKIIVK